MTILSQIVFFGLLGLVILFEGLGLKSGREVAFFLVLMMPLPLYLLDLAFKKNLSIPKKLVFLFLLLFSFLALSTIFSVDRHNAIEGFLLMVSLFLLLTYVFNHQELRKRLHLFIIIGGIIFIFLSWFSSLKPFSSLNFISLGELHNDLGDLLGVVLVLIIYYYLSSRKSVYLLLALPVFYFFLISFSRSGYLAFLISLPALLFQQRTLVNKKFSVLAVTISLIAFSAIFLTSYEIRYRIPFEGFYKVLEKTLQFENRSLLSVRDQYVSWAIDAIRERPLTGYGLQNFIYASAQYSRIPRHYSVSSMNVFLDFFAEGGVVVGLLFIAVILYLLHKAQYHPAILYLLLNMSFVNFRLNSFMIILFLLFGMHLERARGLVRVNSLILISLVLFVFGSSMFFAAGLEKKYRPELAFYFYPINKELIYKKALKEFVIWDQQESNRYFDYLVTLVPAASSYVNRAGNIYLKLGQREKALELFYQAFTRSPYELEENAYHLPQGEKMVFEKIYHLEKSMRGEKAAKAFLKEFIDSKIRMIRKNYYNDTFIYDELNAFCEKEFTICPYEFN